MKAIAFSALFLVGSCARGVVAENTPTPSAAAKFEATANAIHAAEANQMQNAEAPSIGNNGRRSRIAPEAQPEQGLAIAPAEAPRR